MVTSTNNTFSEATFNNNTILGVHFKNADYNILRNSVAMGNTKGGMNLTTNSNYNTFNNLTTSFNIEFDEERHGVNLLDASSYNQFIDCVSNSNSGSGYEMYGGNGAVLYNNYTNITANENGAHGWGSSAYTSYSRIVNSTANSNDNDGFSCSGNLTIFENVIGNSNNDGGIEFSVSTLSLGGGYRNVTNSSFYDNQYYGMRLEGIYDEATNNTVCKSEYSVYETIGVNAETNYIGNNTGCIELIYPLNGTTITTNETYLSLTAEYTMINGSATACTLDLNTHQWSLSNFTKNWDNLTYIIKVGNGSYTWNISCEDTNNSAVSTTETFQLIIIESGDSPNTAGPGGTGGGGTASSGVKSKSAVFKNIKEKQTLKAKIQADDTIPVEEIVAVAAKAADSAKITVKGHSSQSTQVGTPPKNKKVYKYLEIDTDIEVESAEIKFKVPKSWLSANGVSPKDVILLHEKKANVWEELTTTYNSANDGYTATTSGFSVFAIATKEETATTGQAVAESKEVTETITEKTAKFSPVSSFDITKYTSLIVLVIIIIAIILLMKNQRNKNIKFSSPLRPKK